MENWQLIGVSTVVLTVATTPFGCGSDDDDDTTTPTATNTATGTNTGGAGGQGGGGLTVNGVCSALCTLMEACPPPSYGGGMPGGGGPAGGAPAFDCMPECSSGVATCSSQELQQVQSCGCNLHRPCILMFFFGCLDQIPCTSGEGGAGGT